VLVLRLLRYRLPQQGNHLQLAGPTARLLEG